MFCQPGVEKGLVAHCVQRGYNHVRGADFVGLHLNLGDLVHPWGPLPLDGDLGGGEDGEGDREIGREGGREGV